MQRQSLATPISRPILSQSASTVLLISMTLHGIKYDFGQFRPAVAELSQILAQTQPTLCREQNELKTKPWCCAYTAQQHWCIISTVLVTNLKHSTTQAAIIKVCSISARPSAEPSSLLQDAGAALQTLTSPSHTWPGVQVCFQFKQDRNSNIRKNGWDCQSFPFGQASLEPPVASGCLWRSWLKTVVSEITWQCLNLKICCFTLNSCFLAQIRAT